MSERKNFGLIAALGGLALLVFIIISWYINTRNGLVSLEEQVNSAWSEIDNQLKRRSDLIPNLVATVKGFASQEKDVFTNIADARARLAGAATVEEKAKGDSEVQSALSRLLVIAENYPELKSNENFIRLQDELAGTENRLTVARKRYNDMVKQFNTKIRQFPASAIAGSMGFEQKPYFEVGEADKTVPKVDFST
ncbi:MAG: LemA family protein [Spirochaetota bacterium]